jgi:DNA-binding transcriptional MerR regulator
MTDDAPDNVHYLSSATLPAREDRDWITSQELLNDAQITYRQLDYWCRTLLLFPIDHATPGSGHLRRFPADQAHRANCIRILLAAGISLQVIRDVIDQFQHTGTVQLGPLTLTLNHPGDAA